MNYLRLKKNYEAKDDPNEKTKYIDELKENQEKYNYQINKIKNLKEN